FDTDREVIDAALPTIGLTEPPHAKILWIRNTLELSEVECSRAYWDEAQQRSDLEIIGKLHDLPFGADGNLPRYV
ncbi:MAG TPA: [Fe-S]-binding protein, partial [Pirellulales bacterium]|nr:[Fe-S]-binding protein [Pirellulales bacterium]